LDYESPSKSWYIILILGEVDLDNQGRIAEKSDRKICIVFFPSRLLKLFAPCNQLSFTDVARQRTCGNEKFESASTEARSVGSGWLEIIVDEKLGRNNTGRLADAQQARAPCPSSGCRSDPHRVRTLTGIAILSTGTRQKRLDVLGIEFFLAHDRQCGRERRRQAPALRTGLGILYL
jgi:hypothetical protein